MAELADALDSGSSGGNFVEVQVLLPAPKKDRLNFWVRPILFVQVIGHAESHRSFRFRLRNADGVSKKRALRRNSCPTLSKLQRAHVERSSPTHYFPSPTDPLFLPENLTILGFSLHFWKAPWQAVLDMLYWSYNSTFEGEIWWKNLLPFWCVWLCFYRSHLV